MKKQILSTAIIGVAVLTSVIGCKKDAQIPIVSKSNNTNNEALAKQV